MNLFSFQNLVNGWKHPFLDCAEGKQVSMFMHSVCTAEKQYVCCIQVYLLSKGIEIEKEKDRDQKREGDREKKGNTGK